MSRPRRIEYAGAVYQVLARGNRGLPIFQDDQDRQRFLETVGEACQKTGWWMPAYSRMGKELDLGHNTRVTHAVSRLKRKPVEEFEDLKRRRLQMENKTA
jgi:hypothetical protein